MFFHRIHQVDQSLFTDTWQSINTYPYDTGVLDGLNTLTSMSSREWPTADISQVALTLADVCLTASPTIVAVLRPSILFNSTSSVSHQITSILTTLYTQYS